MRSANDVGDVCRHKHGGDRESVGAWLGGSSQRETDRQKILNLLKKRGGEGATSDEVAELWECDKNRISGRFSELWHRLDLIEPSGELRLTRFGKPAKVFVLKGSFAGTTGGESPSAEAAGPPALEASPPEPVEPAEPGRLF